MWFFLVWVSGIGYVLCKIHGVGLVSDSGIGIENLGELHEWRLDCACLVALMGCDFLRKMEANLWEVNGWRERKERKGKIPP